MKPAPLHAPVAVFDAGIGSYAIVDLLHRRQPRQDIIYLADRASFPYREKDRYSLLDTMRRTFRFLERYDPSAIVIASNAPSVMVLDDARGLTGVPLHGVRPPLAEALRRSKTGDIGITLIESPMLTNFIAAHAPDPGRIVRIDAGEMVVFVETGRFLFDPDGTQRAVDAFANKLTRLHPTVDVLTLSSTHLPWLEPFFTEAIPGTQFLDPAEDVIQAMGGGTTGTGRIVGLVTETPAYPLDTFRRMLAAVGADISIERVVIEH